MSTIEGLIRAAVRAELQQLEDRLSALIREEVAAAVGKPSRAEQWLTTTQAAEHLGLKSKTLANWRAAGEGPAYRKVGRVIRYDRAVIESLTA